MVPAIAAGIALAGTAASMYDSYKNREAAKKAYDEIKAKADEVMSANSSDISAYASSLRNTYGKGASQYDQALQDFLNSDTYQQGEFNYGGNINDFYDPAAALRVNQAMNAINNASASGGNRFSSDYINRVGAKQQALASEEWAKAYDRLVQDRQMQLSEYNANSRAGWNNYNAKMDKMKTGLEQYGNDRNALMQGLGDVTTATMNNRLGGLQTMANVVAGNANASQTSNLSSIVGPVASFLGSYYGGKG